MVKKNSPFKTGKAKVGAASGKGLFVSLEPDSTTSMVPLVNLEGMLYADMHQIWEFEQPIIFPCIGENCPGCLVGDEPRFKGYLPVLVHGESEPQVWPFTVSIFRQLEDLENLLIDDGRENGIQGLAIKVSRKGSGLQTRYSVATLGKEVDIDGVEPPNYIDKLGPTTANEIWDLMEERGNYDRNAVSSSDDWGSV